MGFDTRPPQMWEVLQVGEIWIREEGKGLVVEMTIDGAARLARSMQGKRETTDIPLRDYFLEELMRMGKRARLAEKSGS